jgi:hypothetical protein
MTDGDDRTFGGGANSAREVTALFPASAIEVKVVFDRG